MVILLLLALIDVFSRTDVEPVALDIDWHDISLTSTKLDVPSKYKLLLTATEVLELDGSTDIVPTCKFWVVKLTPHCVKVSFIVSSTPCALVVSVVMLLVPNYC